MCSISGPLAQIILTNSIGEVNIPTVQLQFYLILSIQMSIAKISKRMVNVDELQLNFYSCPEQIINRYIPEINKCSFLVLELPIHCDMHPSAMVLSFCWKKLILGSMLTRMIGRL